MQSQASNSFVTAVTEPHNCFSELCVNTVVKTLTAVCRQQVHLCLQTLVVVVWHAWSHTHTFAVCFLFTSVGTSHSLIPVFVLKQREPTAGNRAAGDRKRQTADPRQSRGSSLRGPLHPQKHPKKRSPEYLPPTTSQQDLTPFSVCLFLAVTPSALSLLSKPCALSLLSYECSKRAYATGLLNRIAPINRIPSFLNPYAAV